MFPYYSSPAIRLCYNSRAGSLSPNYLNCAIAQLLNIVSVGSSQPFGDGCFRQTRTTSENINQLAANAKSHASAK